MKVTFLALFLLISGVQAKAISTSNFDMNFASESKGLIHRNGQAHELTGKLYGSIEGSTRLSEKVEETKNGYNEEILNTTRKAQGGASSGSRGRTGTGGTADVNRRPRQSTAPSHTLFWVSIYNLCVSLALVLLFPLH